MTQRRRHRAGGPRKILSRIKHCSVLSAHSEVFKDMFDCPEPNEEEELIEQCPVIHLRDEATDLQIVLRSMYDRR